MPEMVNVTIEIPKWLHTQVKFYMTKFGYTGSEAITQFVRLGIAHYNTDDITNYLQYRARKTATENPQDSEA